MFMVADWSDVKHTANMNCRQLTESIATKTPISFCSQSSQQHSPTVLCKQRPDGTLGFQLTAKRFLRITKRGECDMRGGGGAWTKFFVVEPVDGAIPSMMLYAPKSGLWLTVNAEGQFGSSAQPSVLHLNTTPTKPLQQSPDSPPLEQMPPVDQTALSSQQLASFEQDGFVILRGAIPPPLLQECLRAINKNLANAATDPSEIRLPPQLARDVLDQSPQFWSALNLLLGLGNVKLSAESYKRPQVALRFPENRGRPVNSSQYHIDGMNDKGCGFSLLCGVALSDQSVPDVGNLHVYPGSHLHQPLRQYYIKHLGEPDADKRSDKPYVGEPVQVLLNPGDVVIAHQMLAHAVGQVTRPWGEVNFVCRVKSELVPCHPPVS